VAKKNLYTFIIHRIPAPQSHFAIIWQSFDAAPQLGRVALLVAFVLEEKLFQHDSFVTSYRIWRGELVGTIFKR
jgi:hypothetical protein